MFHQLYHVPFKGVAKGGHIRGTVNLGYHGLLPGKKKGSFYAKCRSAHTCVAINGEEFWT